MILMCFFKYLDKIEQIDINQLEMEAIRVTKPRDLAKSVTVE